MVCNKCGKKLDALNDEYIWPTGRGVVLCDKCAGVRRGKKGTAIEGYAITPHKLRYGAHYGVPGTDEIEYYSPELLLQLSDEPK